MKERKLVLGIAQVIFHDTAPKSQAERAYIYHKNPIRVPDSVVRKLKWSRKV